MKTDAQLKTDVMNELQWEPSIDATHVGVAVNDGIVTLTGHLDTYAEKFAIEHAVQRVEGVKGVAVELDVKLAPDHQRSDTEIALAAESALKWHALVPKDRIQIKVEHGWLTLSGDVDWEYQRKNACSAVLELTGVVGVSNLISIKPRPASADIANRIREALARHAEREARHIEVTVNGSTVTLHGRVDSWAERAAAHGAAWAAPGVSSLVDKLAVGKAKN